MAGPAKSCAGLRRLVQRMERCAALLDIQNQLFLAERAEQKRLDYQKPFDPVAAAEMDRMRARQLAYALRCLARGVEA